ncbi:EpsG family protein [Vibrio breoganii]
MGNIEYLIPLIIATVVLFSNLFVEDGKEKLLFEIAVIFFSITLLTLMISLKGNVEPDYITYKILFDSGPSLFELNSDTFSYARTVINGIEPGLIVFNSIVKVFGGTYQHAITIVAVTSSISIIYIASYFPENRRSIVLLVLMFLFFQGLFIQTRFALSCLLSYVAVIGYLNKRYCLALLLLLLAFSFHIIAVFSLVVILVWRFRDVIYRNIFILFLLLIPLTLFDPTAILKTIIETVMPRYVYYLNFYDGASTSPFPFYWRLCFNLMMLLSFYYCDRDVLNNASSLEKLLLIMCLINVASWSIGYNFPILYRVSWFFDFGYIFYPLVLYKMKKWPIRLILTGLFMIFLYFRVVNGLDSYQPYYFDFV